WVWIPVCLSLRLRLPVALWRVLRQAALGRLSRLLGRGRLLGLLSEPAGLAATGRPAWERPYFGPHTRDRWFRDCAGLCPAAIRVRRDTRLITPRRSGARASPLPPARLRAAARGCGAAGDRCGRDRDRSPA